MSALIPAENRAAAAQHLRAAMAHPTLLADNACWNAALETSLGLWPFYDLDRDLLYARLKAMGNVERKDGA